VACLRFNAGHASQHQQEGRTALMEASMNGHVDVVEALLCANAAVDARNKVPPALDWRSFLCGRLAMLLCSEAHAVQCC
jgi:ankyrin repeat protein